MPKNPAPDQRMAWHAEHAKNCDCRAIPPKLAAEMRRAGYDVPVNESRTN
jgi:hypothetical protein